MTEVTFHLNANSKMDYCCRLIRKAYSNNANVVVKAPNDMLKLLDQALWSFSKTDFIPHAQTSPDSEYLGLCPVILTDSIESLDKLPHHEVLLNLGEEVAQGYEKFERVIEIVGLEESDKVKARLRWRHYAQRGYPITKHEVK